VYFVACFVNVKYFYTEVTGDEKSILRTSKNL
jgi:hypothetical protein